MKCHSFRGYLLVAYHGPSPLPLVLLCQTLSGQGMFLFWGEEWGLRQRCWRKGCTSLTSASPREPSHSSSILSPSLSRRGFSTESPEGFPLAKGEAVAVPQASGALLMVRENQARCVVRLAVWMQSCPWLFLCQANRNCCWGHAVPWWTPLTFHHQAAGCLQGQSPAGCSSTHRSCQFLLL